MPSLSPEFIVMAVAMFAGTFLAVLAVQWRRPRAPVEDNQYAGDGVSEAFEQQVLPILEDSNAQLVAKLRKAALELGQWNPDGITSDDVHSVCPIPDDVDPRVMGAVFLPRKLWRHVGWTKSRRKVNHGRDIRIWQLRKD